MSTFNSLGSNYNFGFVCRTLFASDNKKHFSQLKSFLEEKYVGEVTLAYKGREALRLALRTIDQKDATVGICGFTCYAVYEACAREGYRVAYLDITQNSLHFSFETLKKALQENPKMKILIIQNTLGFPCDIEKIAKFCKEKGIILIEDLAHAIGTKYENGQEAGSVGDFVALSFSQDKMIDGVSGGALIIKNSKFKIKNLVLKKIDKKKQKIDKLYPLFTYLIRKTYMSGLGKILHAVLKFTDSLSKPMDDRDADSLHELPPRYCQAVLDEFENLEKNLQQRNRIAAIYAEKLNKKIQFEIVSKQINLSTNIRYPIFVQNRQGLIAHLKKNNIFVSDIWYDSPVAPKKYMKFTDYNGQCENAEKISKNILNLPTHKNISEKQAQVIAGKVNEWLQ